MSSETHRTVARVARNTSARAIAELVGKLLTLAVLAVLTRRDGTGALGVLVFSLAWVEVASLPIDMGSDRHLQRLIARDRTWIDKGFWNVFLLKAQRAAFVVPASLILLAVLGYSSQTLAVVAILTLAYLGQSARWTVWAVFTAVERGDLIAAALVTERFVSGGLGLAILFAGGGVVGVACAFAFAAILAAGVGFVLLRQNVARPARELPEEPRRTLRGESLAFGAWDYLTAGIARADAILISLLATNVTVGLYGSAYRLLDATTFLPASILGAMSAMFTYLDEKSEPTVGAAFARGIKLCVVLLLPIAIALAVLPGQILEGFFGSSVSDAAAALRLLAPVVVLMGLVMICGSLIASRLNPRALLRAFAIALVVNVVANLILIPAMDQTGAALAMVITELLLLGMLGPMAVGAVGRAPMLATLGSALLAGGVMALVLVALSGTVVLALVAGTLAYAGVFLLVESRVAPADLAALLAIVRRRELAGHES